MAEPEKATTTNNAGANRRQAAERPKDDQVCRRMSKLHFLGHPAYIKNTPLSNGTLCVESMRPCNASPVGNRSILIRGRKTGSFLGRVFGKLGLIRKGSERDRRPTLEELDKLMDHFGRVQSHRPSSIPLQKILPFAIFSTRRQEEITLLRWDDLETDRILVRDMKHPGEKKGNNVRCELTPEAGTIIRSMPSEDERIFPSSADAISAAFTRVCKFLGISDLHFHDLRHEGISRLFKVGRTIPQAAAVSGHRSWTSLTRCTHIRQTGDKYAGWKCLQILRNS